MGFLKGGNKVFEAERCLPGQLVMGIKMIAFSIHDLYD